MYLPGISVSLILLLLDNIMLVSQNGWCKRYIYFCMSIKVRAILCEIHIIIYKSIFSNVILWIKVTKIITPSLKEISWISSWVANDSTRPNYVRDTNNATENRCFLLIVPSMTKTGLG